MHHRLRFHVNYLADLQVPGRARLERLIVKAGRIIEAQVKPYVRETDEGPVEYADLYLAGDGMTLLEVRMEYFSFL